MLISYGDQIKNDIYKIHSRFDNVVNFTDEQNLISITNRNIGGGPYNIVLSSLPSDNYQYLKITDDFFEISDSIILEKSKAIEGKYSSISSYNIDSIYTNISSAISNILKKHSNIGLAFLLKNDRISFQNLSTFERILAEQFFTSYTAILKAIDDNNKFQLLKQLASIKGLGKGLTPSGDDFNSGLLTALSILNAKKELRYEIFNEVKGNNFIVNNFLKQSTEGFISERYKKIITAIESDNFADSSIFLIGHSSGIDFTIGFITCFMKRSIWKFWEK